MSDIPHGLTPEGFADYLDEFDRRALEMIRRYGVYLQGVLEDHEDLTDIKPGFTYTVGLSKVEHPELIVFALPFDVAQSYLNHLAIDHVLKGEARLAPGPLPAFFNDSLDGWLIAVEDSTEHLTMANRFFGGAGPVPALQLIWPDSEGRFPWKENYSHDHRAQPLLGQAPE